MFNITWYIEFQKYVIFHNIVDKYELSNKKYCDGTMQSFLDNVYAVKLNEQQRSEFIQPYQR